MQHVHVLGLLHEELHGPGPLGALSSLAQAEMTLSGTVGQASAHILYRRPQQRPTHEVRRSTGGWGQTEGGLDEKSNKKAAMIEYFPGLLSYQFPSLSQLPCEVDVFYPHFSGWEMKSRKV